jgi:hypothetical protein
LENIKGAIKNRQSKIDNQEKLATQGTPDTEQRQTKYKNKKHHHEFVFTSSGF